MNDTPNTDGLRAALRQAFEEGWKRQQDVDDWFLSIDDMMNRGIWLKLQPLAPIYTQLELAAQRDVGGFDHD